MRADRLISILLLLQTHQRLTAGELARRLEVSERTILRDMDALSAAGIPVLAERGAGGGWRLIDGYETKLTGLNDAEIHALFLQPSRLLADLGLAGAAEAALVKLLAALPAMRRQDAEFVRSRIHVDGAGWFQSREPVPLLPVLQEAVWQERRVQIAYERHDETAVERLVNPLGLVAKGSIWYLIASVEGDLRTYRVSRVQSATTSDEPCTRPADFDLAAFWEQSTSQFVANLPRYPAVFRVDPAALPFLSTMRFARVERVHAPDADGWLKVEMVFDVIEIALGGALFCGAQCEVLEPPELREKVVAAVHELSARYGLTAESTERL